jgi:hypothetical protein
MVYSFRTNQGGIASSSQKKCLLSSGMGTNKVGQVVYLCDIQIQYSITIFEKPLPKHRVHLELTFPLMPTYSLSLVLYLLSSCQVNDRLAVGIVYNSTFSLFYMRPFVNGREKSTPPYWK